MVSKLVDIFSSNTSNDIVSGMCHERIPYDEWLRQKHAEYESMAGPVNIRVNKAECEKLLAQMGV